MIEFDGIGFENLNELLNFLKHSYFAHKSRIKTLERTLQETIEQQSPGKATAKRLDKLFKALADEL